MLQDMLNSIQYKNITWIDIHDPRENDITYLKENFNFHELVLEELIPPGHRQKVEHSDGYIFFILYYPIFHKESEETFSRELDILVTKTHIITSHYETIIPLKSLFDQINLYDNAKTKYMSESTGHLLFYIMREILENTLSKLEYISNKVNYIEEKIFKGEERKMVFEISVTKRNIIDFRRILAPQQSVIESLVSEGTNFFGEEIQPYFADLRGTFGILWNEIQNHNETINALAQTNESLLSTKINEVIKIFTIFSVVFLPLTLIASIWGMNIQNMPLTENVSGFWIITVIMAVVLVTMLGYFKSKKWL